MDEGTLTRLAIQAALENDWEKAVEINSQILDKNPTDTESLNRLAHACSELGNEERARDCYEKVLKVDPANSIAIKNLKLLEKTSNLKAENATNGKNGENGFNNGVNGKNGHKNFNQGLSLDIFLTEPGKTKLVNLVKTAPPTTLYNHSCGEKVQMVFKKYQVIIQSLENEYLGAIPDDLSRYLISLTTAGNNYEAYIKSIKNNSLTLIVLEKERSARFYNQPSFLTRKQAKISAKASKNSLLEIEIDESFVDY